MLMKREVSLPDKEFMQKANKQVKIPQVNIILNTEMNKRTITD